MPSLKSCSIKSAKREGPGTAGKVPVRTGVPWGGTRDAVGGERGGGDVGEDARAGRRRVEGIVLGLQEKDGHLGAGDGAAGAVVAAAAAARDAVVEEVLDEGIELLRRRHVRE